MSIGWGDAEPVMGHKPPATWGTQRTLDKKVNSAHFPSRGSWDTNSSNEGLFSSSWEHFLSQTKLGSGVGRADRLCRLQRAPRWLVDWLTASGSAVKAATLFLISFSLPRSGIRDTLPNLASRGGVRLGRIFMVSAGHTLPSCWERESERLSFRAGARRVREPVCMGQPVA